jgi:hypothetical protein
MEYDWSEKKVASIQGSACSPVTKCLACQNPIGHVLPPATTASVEVFSRTTEKETARGVACHTIDIALRVSVSAPV